MVAVAARVAAAAASKQTVYTCGGGGVEKAGAFSDRGERDPSRGVSRHVTEWRRASPVSEDWSGAERRRGVRVRHVYVHSLDAYGRLAVAILQTSKLLQRAGNGGEHVNDLCWS